MEVLRQYEKDQRNRIPELDNSGEIRSSNDLTKPLQVARLAICEEGGNCTGNLESGQSYELVLECAATKDVRNAWLIVTVSNAAEQMLLYLNTTHECGPKHIPRGDFSVKLSLKGLGLITGNIFDSSDTPCRRLLDAGTDATIGGRDVARRLG